MNQKPPRAKRFIGHGNQKTGLWPSLDKAAIR